MNLYAEKALEISKISIGHEERTTDWIHSRLFKWQINEVSLGPVDRKDIF